MKGSEKQIKWATDIIAALQAAWERILTSFGDEPPEKLQKYMASLLNEEDAHKIINSGWQLILREKTPEKQATWLYFHLLDKEEELGEETFDWLGVDHTAAEIH